MDYLKVAGAVFSLIAAVASIIAVAQRPINRALDDLDERVDRIENFILEELSK